MFKLTNEPKKDINMVREIATKVFKNFPHIINLTVAQAILESDLDDSNNSKKASSLATKYNNLFGIKWPKSPSVILQAKKYGKPIYLDTKEERKGKIKTEKHAFIHFNSLEDCLEYRKYMLSWNRYKNVYKAKNLKEAALEMQKGGYATDSSYVTQITSKRIMKWIKN